MSALAAGASACRSEITRSTQRGGDAPAPDDQDPEPSGSPGPTADDPGPTGDVPTPPGIDVAFNLDGGGAGAVAGRGTAADPYVLPLTEGTHSLLSFAVSSADAPGVVAIIACFDLPSYVRLDPSTMQLALDPTYDDAGTASFRCEIRVAGALVSGLSFTTTVADRNRAPVATVDANALTIAEGASGVFRFTVSDPDGDALTLACNGAPAFTTLDAAAGTLTVQPGYTDAGGPLDFVCRCTDARNAVATIALRVTVTETDRAPTLALATSSGTGAITGDGTATTPLAFTLQEGAAAAQVVLAAADPDGTAVTVACTGLPAWASLTPATRTIAFAPDYTHATVTPAAFTCSATSGGLSAELLRFAVTVADVNRSPIAVDDAMKAETAVATAISPLANDSDPDSDELTIASATDGAHGTVVVDGVAGTLTYTSEAAWSGVDSFQYTVEDGRGGSATATVTVYVYPTPTAYTWSGGGTTDAWSEGANWHGGVAPGPGHVARFSAFCALTGCDAAIGAQVDIAGLVVDGSYQGTITQAASANIKIGTGGFTFRGGSFHGSAASLASDSGLTLAGGTFRAPSGTTRIAYTSGSYTDTTVGFIKTGGTFDANGGTVTFVGRQNLNNAMARAHRAFRITLDADVQFAGLAIDTADTNTSDGNPDQVFAEVEDAGGKVIVTGTLRHVSGRIYGAIEARGDLVVECADGASGQSCARGGTGVITMAGSSNATYTCDAAATAAYLAVAKTGAARVDPADLTTGLNTGEFRLTSGTFAAPRTTLRLGWILPPYAHASGGFAVTGGTFEHNSGTVDLAFRAPVDNPMASASRVGLVNVAPGVEFNDLILNATDTVGNGANYDQVYIELQSGSSLLVLGTFEHRSGQIRGGTIHARGDALVSCPDGAGGKTCARGGTTALTFDSGDSQTLTIEADADIVNGALRVEPATTLTLGSDLSLAVGQTLTVDAALVDRAGHVITGGTVTKVNGGDVVN